MGYVLHNGLLVNSLDIHDDTLEDIEPSVVAWLRELLKKKRHTDQGETDIGVPPTYLLAIPPWPCYSEIDRACPKRQADSDSLTTKEVSMTKQEGHIISEALGEMEDAVNTLTGVERRQVCELMQQLSTLAGNPHDLEECREEMRQFHGCVWPAPAPDRIARPSTLLSV